MQIRKRNFKHGFTLVELLVTISIFAILTGIVLFNQGKFNSTILLTNLAYDTALTIREAQTYGINIKEFGTSQFVPYGVHFDISNTGNDKSFILFADVNYDLVTKILTPFSPVNINTCNPTEGCVSRYSIKRGNLISKICVLSNTVGSYDCDVKILDIIFKRPDPDAVIYAGGSNSTEYNKAIITLTSADDSGNKTVTVQANGLIEIGN